MPSAGLPVFMGMCLPKAIDFRASNWLLLPYPSTLSVACHLEYFAPRSKVAGSSSLLLLSTHQVSDCQTPGCFK